MSIHLMSLVWEIKFPTLTQKCVLLKLADHATDDGDSVFPANETLAYQIGCDKRSIQRNIKALEQMQLLTKVHAGGRGDGDTNQWKIEVDRLIDLASGDLKIIKNDESFLAVDNQGGTLPPSAFARVTKLLRRVTRVSSEGDTRVTQTTNNHHIEPSGACADARESSRTSLAGEKYTGPMFDLTPRDISWNEWIVFIENQGRHDLADEARDKQILKVKTKWPNPEKGLQGLIAAKSRKTIDITARMIGEGE